MQTLIYTAQRLPLRAEKDGHAQWLSAFAVVANNGLGYYRVLNCRGREENYVVFHAASGLSVVPQVVRIRTPKQCKQIIAALDPLTDWRQSKHHVCEAMQNWFVAFLDALEPVGVQLQYVVGV